MSKRTLLNGRVGALDVAPLGVSLKAFGLTDATTDIKTIIDRAVAWGTKRIVVPYRAAAWPCLTTITMSGGHLDFEPGARISFNFGAGALGANLTNVRLTNAAFTSPYTAGPTSIADVDDAGPYAYASRSVRLNGGCVIEGYDQEYAAGGIEIAGALNVGRKLAFRNIRMYKGWGAALHTNGASAVLNHFSDYTIADCDRGNETEISACYNTFENSTQTRVGPIGYTGQPVDFADYTFVLDVHSHSGEGACVGNVYRHHRLVDCQGGIDALRSNGSTDADLPRDNLFEDIVIEGRVGTTGNDTVQLHGYRNKVRNLRMSVGSGITSKMLITLGNGAPAYDCEVEVAACSAFALPFFQDMSTGVGNRLKLRDLTNGTMTGTGYLMDLNATDFLGDVEIYDIPSTTRYINIGSTATRAAFTRLGYSVLSSETFNPMCQVAANNVTAAGIEGRLGGSLNIKEFVTGSNVVGLKLIGRTARTAAGISVDFGGSASNCDATQFDPDRGRVNDSGNGNTFSRHGLRDFVCTIGTEPGAAALARQFSVILGASTPHYIRMRTAHRLAPIKFRVEAGVIAGNIDAAIINSSGSVIWKQGLTTLAGFHTFTVSGVSIARSTEYYIGIILSDATASVRGLDLGSNGGLYETSQAVPFVYVGGTLASFPTAGNTVTIGSTAATKAPLVTLLET